MLLRGMQRQGGNYKDKVCVAKNSFKEADKLHTGNSKRKTALMILKSFLKYQQSPFQTGLYRGWIYILTSHTLPKCLQNLLPGGKTSSLKQPFRCLDYMPKHNMSFYFRIVMPIHWYWIIFFLFLKEENIWHNIYKYLSFDTM